MEYVTYATAPLINPDGEGPPAQSVEEVLAQMGQHPAAARLDDDPGEAEMAAAMDPLIFDALIRP